MKARLHHSIFSTAVFMALGANLVCGQGSNFTTAFSYQGRLLAGTNVVNGFYDMIFTLSDDNGVVIGTITNPPPIWTNICPLCPVVVSNGLFQASLDFGAGAFSGGTRWLEIGVRSNGLGNFSNLSPRQPVAPVPYAITAGAVPGLTIQQNASSPNVIAGHSANTAGTGVVGAVIAGGGTNGELNVVISSFGTIGGGIGNRAGLGGPGGNPFATVGGGQDNHADGAYATAGGGQGNNPAGGWSVIGGGVLNYAYTYGTVGGGAQNNAGLGSTVGGGRNNNASGAGAVIAGGGYDGSLTLGNTAGGAAAVIGGGAQNSAGGRYATIAGGLGNIASGDYSFVGGGRGNDPGPYSFVGGGQNNAANSSWSSVVGGLANTNLGDYSFIGGGSSNSARGNFSVVVGGSANLALGLGAFVGGGGYDGFVEGPFPNVAAAVCSVVTGGIGNTNQSPSGTIAGGAFNLLLGSGTGRPTIGGGSVNTIGFNAHGATIGGGDQNTVEHDAEAATVGGGSSNTAAAIGAVIAGGGADRDDLFGFYTADGNYAAGIASAIGGGVGNSILVGEDYSTVAGGYHNAIGQPSFTSTGAVVAGGINNTNAGSASSIAGGSQNLIYGAADYSSIAGGLKNSINAKHAVIAGGYSNQVTAPFGSDSAIGGGTGNRVDGGAATIAGGSGNVAQGSQTSIGGGAANQIQGGASLGSTIAGGWANVIQNSSQYSVIAGGSTNVIQSTASYGAIGGGSYNFVIGTGAFIGGGGNGSTSSGSRGKTNNFAAGVESVIGGGAENTATGRGSAVVGGEQNSALADGAFVGGGTQGTSGLPNNTASGTNSVVSGGLTNTASGNNSVVPGGDQNVASGKNSFAAGHRARARGQGSFIWADSTEADFDPLSGNNNLFAVRATGATEFITAVDGTGNPTAGVYLLNGDTSWRSLSDRNAKKNFAPVDCKAILDKLACVPVQQWNYQWEKDTAVPNIGPMAQDFKAAFYPGRDQTSISTMEFDGVELAAIQALNQALDEQKNENARLKTQNEILFRRLATLEAAVKTLAADPKSAPSSPTDP